MSENDRQARINHANREFNEANRLVEVSHGNLERAWLQYMEGAITSHEYTSHLVAHLSAINWMNRCEEGIHFAIDQSQSEPTK